MDLVWQISIVGLWAAFIIQCVFILALFRYIGLILKRLPRQGLPIGEKAPVQAVEDTKGERLVLGKPAPLPCLVLFMSPICPVCDELLDVLGSFAVDHREHAQILIVTDTQHGDPDTAKYHVTVGQGEDIRLVGDPDLIQTYEVPGTPYAIVLDRGAVVRAASYVNNINDLERMLAPVLAGGRDDDIAA